MVVLVVVGGCDLKYFFFVRRGKLVVRVLFFWRLVFFFIWCWNFVEVVSGVL